ncbi:NBAS subunit of NRZ tethering complex-like [Hydractinia symbiolongicarpus]|uniref:NBAS subunit of NRZ tethering complex-like n=1 Tax=Hydractinia symbiolongicarpus TaxID=13093 RepID=UPI00254FB76D|nr:NBAS subunit of NRZ tethering complex-like [Hydractinia symbiolongicarpus]
MSEQILYDLIVNEEWVKEPQILNEVENYFWQHRGSLFTKLWKVTQGSASYLFQVLKTQLRYQTSFGCPPHHFINLINNSLPWTISLSRNGRFVAVLLDDNIEIRTASDNFSTIVANCKVAQDVLPQWRKLAWNDDNSFLAYSNSFGDVTLFDITGTQTCLISQVKTGSLNVRGKLSQAVAFLHFTPADDSSWKSILYIGTYQGYLKCHYIHEDGTSKEKCSFSFTTIHPYGVSSIVFDWKNNLLIVAGNYGKEPFQSSEEQCYASHCAISVWRLLTDFPYFKLVEDRSKALKKLSGKEYLKKFVNIHRRQDNELLMCSVFKIALSPDATRLVSLHIDGRISVWHIPSAKLEQTWHKSEQPERDTESSGFESKAKNDFLTNVIDVNWWSEKELILASGNGDVTISSIEDLRNLLGDSPEKFDNWPMLSQAVDGCVLVLECERIISEQGEKNKAPETTKWLSEHDEEEDYSFRSKIKELIKQTLYFLTEANRFAPAIKAPRILSDTYRLVCLKRTTPEGLYIRKIELEHYGEALDLAQRFNLDTDLVYQKQWRKKPVTKISIHDYLTKVKDRYWVLDECLLRIPDDFDAMEELLKYGLLGTSWEVFQVIDKTDKNLKFVVEKKSNEGLEEEKEDIIFTGALSPQQLKLCGYRWQLLQFLDRLSTYEVILGGSFKARDKFSAKYFSKFRSCNIVHQAIEYARDEDSIALEHLFSYHGKDVLPHWLPLLSNFPETTNLRDFEPVIPEIGETSEDPEILPWLEKNHRDEDWVEQESIMKQIQNDLSQEQNLGEFIYEAQPELMEFKNCEKKNVLERWFKTRINEIDVKSQQIDKCLELAKLGLKRGLSGLKELRDNLEIMYTLVYDVVINKSIHVTDFFEMDDLSKMKLLMSKTTETTFIADFKTYLRPYLASVSRKSYKKKQELLHRFMTDIAKSDLSCCLKLFQQCSPEIAEPLIPDVAEQIKLAIDCIYACMRDDQLNMAFDIVECLPSREEGIISSQIEELHTQLDQLELILSGVEILEYYSHPKTISYVNETKSNAVTAKELLQILIKNTTNKKTSAKPADWNTLLKHSIKLVQDVYTCVDVKTCHQIFVEGLLQSEVKQTINLAKELLSPMKQGGPHHSSEAHLKSALCILPYDVSVKVVVNASQLYFNAASSLNDALMDLARLCLSFITQKPDIIQDELNLINCLQLLYDFNVTMLPLHVRVCPDKLELIELCLKEKSSNYKKIEKLLKIGDLLKICGEDTKERYGKIRIKIAVEAFENQDYLFTSALCHRLTDDGYEPAWEICRKLGQCNDYMNYTSRQKLLSFVLTYCPIYHIEDILNEKTLLETQILYEKLSEHIKDEEQDSEDIVDGNQSSIIKKTRTQTKKLISGVTDTKWVSDAMKWVQTSKNVSHSTVQDDTFSTVEYPPFYQSLAKRKLDNKVKMGLQEYFDCLAGLESEVKVTNSLLLRSQKLSERRAEGEVIEETDEALVNLAAGEFKQDSLLSIAYMMALSSPNLVAEVFNKQRRTKFNFIFAAYYHALQLYTNDNSLASKSIADVYSTEPKQILTYMLKRFGNEDELAKHESGRCLITNLTNLSDLLQAHMLQDLDKGVDIERFAVDNEYKKETILGLAMSTEETLMDTCILLADKYDVELWEVMLSHVEFLFTDSGLKAKAIRDDLNKWNIENTLKGKADKVFDRLKKYVYPELDGNDHNILLLFYVFLLNCTSPTRVLEGKLNLDAHVKLLKKIKAAAPSLDYKALIHGNAPLEVIKTSVKENNVHLLAKIASKIPQSDGSFLTANKVFLAYMKNAFWQPDKNTEKLDWLHHFESCQKFLPKINTMDVVEFFDHIIFSENAFDLLTHDVRIEITNRLLKYMRQQKGADEEKLKGQDNRDEVLGEYDAVLTHLQEGLKHLNTLQSDVFWKLMNSEKETRKTFAKNYDLSKGDGREIQDLCSRMFQQFESPELIASVLSLNGQAQQIGTVLQNTLQVMLGELQKTSDSSNFKELVKTIKTYNKDSGTEVGVVDFLEVVRPFCSDVNVSTELKSTVLHLLEEAFQLSGEDVFLLLYFQSEAIISSKWAIKIREEDIDTDTKRYEMFCKLHSETTSSEQAYGLEQLLASWPTLSVTKNSDESPEKKPWMKLLLKLIKLQEYSSVIDVLHKSNLQSRLTKQDYQHIYTKLKHENFLLALKVMLSSSYDFCYDETFDDISMLKVDDFDTELLELLLESKTFHRTSNSHIFETAMQKVVSIDNPVIVETVVTQLSEAGLEAEAGSLMLRFNQTHASLYTLQNALEFIKTKFSR